MQRRRRLLTLPIRRWLALALIVLVVVPTFSAGAVVAHLLGMPADEGDELGQHLRENPEQWENPIWQAETAAEYAGTGTEFILVVDRVEIFRSTPDLFADPDRQSSAVSEVREVVVEGDPPRRAYIFTDAGAAAQPFWIVPIIAVVTFLLTIIGVAWFLGWSVVRPLSATSEAARQVAAGNLDISLPASRVREVADLNAAFETMSRELRVSLEQQAEIEQERRMLISSVAHDLRTPLFSLRGSLEGLEKGIADTPEKRQRYVAVAQEKANALERLITDLFTYVRLEYLDQAPSRERLDLGALLRHLVEGLQPQAEMKGVELVLRAEPGTCIASGDGHMLTRAVGNILDNALRYTPAGGDVEIDCFARDGETVFTIKDGGPGIPQRDLPHIFTPLYRGDSSRNRRTGGAGLGLTIARRIIHAHGGELTAVNSLRGGAIFTGTLPQPEGAPSPRDSRAPASTVGE